MKLEMRLKLGFAVVAVVLLLTSFVPFQTARMAREIGVEVEMSLRRVEMLREVLLLAHAAETGQRGFVITGNEEFLEPYHAAIVRLRELWPALSALLWDDEAIRPEITRLEAALTNKLDTVRKGIALRRAEGFEAARAAVVVGTGKQQMDEIRSIVLALDQHEMAKSEVLLAERDRRATKNAYAGLMVTALDLILLSYLLYLFAGLARARRLANEQLRQTENSLKESLAALEERNEGVSAMVQLGHVLETASSLEELYRLIAAHGVRLLPGTAWALYAYRNSRDLLELKASWGEADQWAESIEPDECWALRRGQPHESLAGSGLVCAHYRPDLMSKNCRFRCFPLIAHGEVLGMLSVRSEVAGDGEESAKGRMFNAIAEQLSLAISNLRLREALRLQSVTDPLTGLFNRRYMDETLRRELSRAQRKQSELSVVMLDLDHFKRINDEHGHDVGDAVLRAVAQQVKTLVRGGDVPCRYGGEEFALVLPDCNKADAAIRSREILQAIRALSVQAGAGTVGTISASLGVATFPKDGQDPHILVQAADRALYRAKHGGRNQVVLSGQGEDPGG